MPALVAQLGLVTFQLGLVAMTMNPRFQRLGDLVCGTMVVIEDPQRLYGVAKVEDPEAIRLAGFLPAAHGEISIGGVPLSDRTAGVLRQRIAWMGQRPHVFAGSVESNVALGRAGVGTSQVAAAMRFASLETVAQAHPGVALGEGGIGLSGGEAVRLALARIAVHRHADLLLVDEPTAHLDTETATQVADALLALARGKTLLVATHDPVLAARMNRSIRLDAEPADAADAALERAA